MCSVGDKEQGHEKHPQPYHCLAGAQSAWLSHTHTHTHIHTHTAAITVLKSFFGKVLLCAVLNDTLMYDTMLIGFTLAIH